MTALRRMIVAVVHDFVDFVLHQKKWWLTMLIIIVVAFAAVAFFSGQPAVRPMIYMD